MRFSRYVWEIRHFLLPKAFSLSKKHPDFLACLRMALGTAAPGLHSLRLIDACTSYYFRANGDGEIRTLDPLLARQVLSQLSYTPTDAGLPFKAIPVFYFNG